jgi:hypothetical protein
VDGAGPAYPEWNSKFLAELALLRVTEFTIYQRPVTGADLDHDFLVTAAGGLSLFIQVRGFSSHHQKVKAPATVPEWRWAVEADTVRKARRSPTPLVLFLFDANTECGRFARLDTLPEPPRTARTVVVAFPVENTITPDRLRELAAELRQPHHAATG